MFVQVCGKPVTSRSQKLLQPPGSTRLVIVLHDIDLVRTDKYDTAQLLAFVEHILQHGGFYDSHLDFVALRRIQFVATAGASSGDGILALPVRLARSMYTLSLTPAAESDLVDALTPRAKAATAAAGAPVATASRVASAALKILSAFSAAFSRHTAFHYAVSLHDAAFLLDGMCHYDWGETVADVWDVLQNEARIRFQCRLQTAAEHAQFTAILQACLSAIGIGAGTNGGGAVYSTLGSSSDERLTSSEEAKKLCRWTISDFKELVRTCYLEK